jgi:hypothetical protein
MTSALSPFQEARPSIGILLLDRNLPHAVACPDSHAGFETFTLIDAQRALRTVYNTSSAPSASGSGGVVNVLSK